LVVRGLSEHCQNSEVCSKPTFSLWGKRPSISICSLQHVHNQSDRPLPIFMQRPSNSMFPMRLSEFGGREMFTECCRQQRGHNSAAYQADSRTSSLPI
jgi:hypothetical protein